MASETRLPRFALLIPAIVLVAGASRAADPTMADCIGANEKSILLRQQEHLREAREQLLVCAARTCPNEVRAQCEQHIIEVNASMPTIVFEAKDAAGDDLSAVSVSMDGKPLAERLEGTAISIDPGPHSFHFESAGLLPVDRSFVLHQGEKERRERISFAGPAAASPAPASPPKMEAGALPLAPEAPRSSSTPLRTAGLVTAAAGLVGLGVGVVFGLVAASDKGSASCDANGYCAPGPLRDARTHADISTAGFIVGGVLAAAGLGLVLFAPRDSKATPQMTLRIAPAVARQRGGLVVEAVF